MIKANELRLGNLVIDKVTNTIGPVVMIDPRDNDIYEGIPLTPEILEKAGFEKHVSHSFVGGFSVHYQKDNFALEFNNEKQLEFKVCQRGANALVIANLEYLHQLQNLYFTLTGTELTIEL